MENKKDSVVICPGAQVLGDVELGEDVSIWHGAVVRGDVDSIKITTLMYRITVYYIVLKISR
jgi:carbonic anhydrase/acetyltransferase-like protein (isoleucine patch superfamily)